VAKSFDPGRHRMPPRVRRESPYSGPKQPAPRKSLAQRLAEQAAEAARTCPYCKSPCDNAEPWTYAATAWGFRIVHVACHKFSGRLMAEGYVVVKGCVRCGTPLLNEAGNVCPRCAAAALRRLQR
jgi:hypothetical protein